MTEWIISSCVLIAAIVLIRWLFKRHISLGLQYALWGLVLLRLLVPVNLFQSSFSVSTAAQQIAMQPAIQSVADRLSTPSQNYENALNEVINAQYPPEVDYNSLPADARAELDAQVQVTLEKSTPAYTLKEFLLYGWVLGFVIVSLCLLAVNCHFAFRLGRSRQRLECADSPITVYICDAMQTPCLFGLLRPAVYLTPETAADPQRLHHVLAHEITHFRHGDYVWSAARCLCLALHWYNPLVWLAASLSRRDAELACDEATIRRIGEENRADYGRTLIDMTCVKASPKALMLTATTMISGKKSLRERVLLIAKKPKVAISAVVTVLLVVCLVAGCTFAGAGSTTPSIPDATTPPDTTAATEATQVATSAPSSGLRNLMVYYNGDLYYGESKINDTDFLKDWGWNEVVKQDNSQAPSQSYVASNIPVNTRLYRNPEESGVLYAKLDSKVIRMTIDEDDFSFRELLEWYDGNFYNMAMTSAYTSAKDLDLYHFFYNGLPEEPTGLTTAEQAFLSTYWSEDAFQLNVIRLPVEKMDAVLRQYLGIGFADMSGNGLDRMVYYPDTNSYYLYTGGIQYEPFFIDTIISENGIHHVYYSDYILTLKETENGFQVISNYSPDMRIAQSNTIYFFQNWLDDRWYRCILGCTFSKPEEVDVFELFYNGIPGEYYEITEEEENYLISQGFELMIDIQKSPVQDMEYAMQTSFGISLSQADLSKLDLMTYYEATDCYYTNHSGANGVSFFRVTNVMANGNQTAIYYTTYPDQPDYSEYFVVTLVHDGENYKFLSNLPV